MLKGSFKNAVLSRPIIFLAILFLLIVGITSGVASHLIEFSPLDSGSVLTHVFSISVLPLIISILKNALVFCSCILLAVWLPGIAVHIVTLSLDGFLMGFTICALIRSSVGLGMICSLIGVVVPNLILFYGFIMLSIYSFSEWQTRFKSYFSTKTVQPVSPEYRGILKPCLFAVALGVFLEGILSPLLIHLL